MNPYTINPPESEVDFEKLCLALLKRHWSRPGLERFAKRGEEQFGVDIFDTLGESPLYGAQCKLKEQRKSLEPAEIREEVGKAKTFPSKLDHYGLLTTGKISGAAQLAIQAINQEHKPAGLFTVELFTWEKLTELLRQYPEIEGQFYGGLRSQEVAVVSSKLDYIIARQTESVTATSATSEIDALIDEARTHITPSSSQIAVLLLNRILRTKGDALSDWHRFRIFTNLGVATGMIGKAAEAARYFLKAKPFRPDDELAVTNEVLAYNLLGQEEETHERAAAALDRFPDSTRLRSLWIQSARSDKNYEELLDATPGHMQKDAEVASALCRKALTVRSIGRAIEHARDAVEDKPKWSQAHLLLGQAYLASVVFAGSIIMPLKPEDKEMNLAKSLAAVDAAISVAENELDSLVKAEAFALKSDIALIQGRKDDAARFARDSFGADSTNLHGRLAMAQASFSLGSVDEGVRILEEAYARADSGANVSFMLGQALMARATQQDVNRAVEVLTAAKIDNLKPELIDPIIVASVRALVRAKRFTEIPKYAARAEHLVSPMVLATVKAYAALKQSLDVEATQFLNDAITSRQSTDSLSATEFLARTLMEAGRLSDALPLLQELFNSQTQDFDVGLLLDCASRLREDRVILDTCQALYERGVRGWHIQEFEVQYLEEYDFRKAISRLQEFIAADPTHRVAKVRLAIIGMRYGQDDLVHVSEQVLPDPEDLPMRYAVPVVHLLHWHGQGRLAVDYAYRFLRAHYAELEAHRAYLVSLLAGARPEDIPATMAEVEIGSAVQYAESGDASVGWFVIEDTNKPNSEFEEIPVQSAIAQELMGKKVGDSFVLAKSPIRDRVGKVVQILSKYTRRFQVVGEQMQLRFGTQSDIHTMRVPPPEKVTAADLEPVLDSVRARAEAVSKLREIYRSTLVTLHMYSSQLGLTAHEGIVDLAVSEDGFVRCAPPQMTILASTLATLGAKSTLVLDLTSLATLRLLGITRQALTTTAFRFLISQATFVELQQLRAKSRFSTAYGTMYYEKGQHHFVETSEDQSEKQKAAFEDFVQCVERNAEVVPMPQLATLTHERRDLLERILGRSGLESALLALSPGYIWWTDDFASAEVAKSELGVERTWTQAVLEHFANLGLIDRGLVDEAYANLVGFDYQSTHFTGAVIVAALRVSGSVDGFPMRQAIRAFEPLPSTNRNLAFRLLAEFILKMTLEPSLPETRCIATKALLNTFPNDASTNVQLGLFRSQCAGLMTLNPLAQADFIRCFDQWNKEKSTLGIIL